MIRLSCFPGAQAITGHVTTVSYIVADLSIIPPAVRSGSIKNSYLITMKKDCINLFFQKAVMKKAIMNTYTRRILPRCLPCCEKSSKGRVTS